MPNLYDDMDEAAKLAGGFVQPDPTTDFKVRQDQIARRRKLAEQLVAQAASDNGGAGYHGGKVYMVGNQWGNVARDIGGAVLGGMADKQETELTLQQRMAQKDWSDKYNAATDDATKQKLIVEARDKGLKFDLENAFRKEEADRIEKGEQLAATREATAAEKEANRAFLASQGELNRQNRLDVRQSPSVIIHQGGGAANADLDRQIKEARLAQLTNPKPKLTAAQSKAADDADVFLGHIDNAIDLLNTNPEALGMKTMIPDVALQRIYPEGVATRAAIGGLSAAKIHELSGAAVSAQEFARLRPYLPASGDSTETVQKKLQGLRKEAVRIRERHAQGRTDATPSQENAGTPVAIKSQAEWQALPPGTPYTLPDGRKGVR